MRKTEKDIIIQKSDIISTAYKIFSEKGYAAANMEDIARELGISRTPLYYHFNNKESLFLSVVEYYYGVALQRHREIFNGSKNIFEKIALDLKSCYDEKARLLEKLLSDIERLEQTNPRVKSLHQKYTSESFKVKYSAVEDAVERGELRPDIDVNQFVVMIFSGYYSLISSSAQELLSVANIDSAAMVERYVDMMRNTYGK